MHNYEKLNRIPVRIVPQIKQDRLPQPPWIRVKFPSTSEVMNLKQIFRENKLVTICEEVSRPNIGECFGNGTGTFMILGDIFTRRWSSSICKLYSVTS